MCSPLKMIIIIIIPIFFFTFSGCASIVPNTLNKLDEPKVKTSLESEMKHLSIVISQLRHELDEVKSQLEATALFLHACGAQKNKINLLKSGVTYSNDSKLSNTYTNIPNANTSFNMETGIFTVPCSGFYTVSWSFLAQNSYDDWEVEVYLKKNNMKLEDSVHNSFHIGTNEATISGDQG